MREYLLYLYAESPVHAGGAESDGLVDLPIQREVSTGYPVIWGQSLKGALRQAAHDAQWNAGREAGSGEHQLSAVEQVFGRMASGGDDDVRNTTAGLLSVGDAQLVALPVPTLQRGFAWATSRLALSRLARKHARLNSGHTPPDVPEVGEDYGLCANVEWTHSGQVIGPCVVNIQEEEGERRLAAWAGLIAREGIGTEPHMSVPGAKFREDLLMVGEAVMAQLLRECTEHSVRVQLEQNSKVVKEGPFTSEYLPTETLMVSVLTLRERGGSEDLEHHHELLRELLHGRVLQIGGDETLGKGLMWARLVEAT
ncbi:type III-B CRISPR module RAMP protein Cmr4 [Nocardiopsis sp. NPDC006938]|uniref:type III-B CRISPR module RAMP protein Cmr4 n=1 Tax=Nocardiopsis sp. NPDC006938 TaxID=3364337 RepID=UPI0036D058F0